MTTAPEPPRSSVHLHQDAPIDSLEQSKRIAYEKGSMAYKGGTPREDNPMAPGLYTPQEQAAWDLGWSETKQRIEEHAARDAGKVARSYAWDREDNPYSYELPALRRAWDEGWLEAGPVPEDD